MYKERTLKSVAWINRGGVRRWDCAALIACNFLVLYSLGFSAAVQAESADAGQLMQQIEKERGAELPKRTLPDVIIAPQPQESVKGATITVTSFQFAGNTLITSDLLQKRVAAFTNHPISFAELQSAAVAVAEAYREAGWIVRSYLPQQDIQNGVVTIQVVEAVFGGAHQEGEQSSRLTWERAVAKIDAVQRRGDPINVDNIERGVLLVDDLPGVSAAVSLQPGAAEKETVLVLKLIDEPLINGSVAIDNTGLRSTGRERITGNIYLNSPSKRGDLAVANLIHSEGINYARLAYSMPQGNVGWRTGISVAALSYNLVADEFKALDGEGGSTTFGVDATLPMIRSHFKNLYLGLNYDHKRFDNETRNVTSSRYSINRISVSLNGNLFDRLGNSGNSAGLTLTGGSVDLGSLDFNELGAPSGSFTKLNYYASRQQAVTDSISAIATLSGQAASAKLDSSEKFSLGGAAGVRAYPANEGSGSSGQLLNLEVRQRLPKGYNASGFFDVGHVNNTGASSNSYMLKGAGLALGWQAQLGLNLKATWAHRIGSNPNPTLAGNDQDGSLNKNRFWLQASMPF